MNKLSKIPLYFIITTLLIFLSACSNVDAEQSNNTFIVKAKNATKKYNLSKIPVSCLNFILQSEKFEGKVIVDVREIHNAKCGGDPETSPRLFSIGFDESKKEICAYVERAILSECF